MSCRFGQPKKLREGNVFTGIYHSVQRGVGSYPPPGTIPLGPYPPAKHYSPVDKLAVCILLECFLVIDENISLPVNLQEIQMNNVHTFCCLFSVRISNSCILCNFYRPQIKFAKVMFLHLSVSHSVHRGVCLGPYPGNGWWVWLGGCLGPQPGEVGRGLARECPHTHLGGVGMSRPTPWGVQVQAHGGVSQHALSQTPPSIQLLVWVVRILL